MCLNYCAFVAHRMFRGVRASLSLYCRSYYDLYGG